MDENGRNDGDDKSFGRPWEEDTTERDREADVVPLPGIEVDDGEDDEDPFLADDEPEEEDAASSELDEFSPREYTAYSTQEYEGLAEDVARAASEEWEQQAVSASVAGVDSGMVGFDDVAGTARVNMEDHEVTAQAAASDFALRVASAFVIFGLFLGSLLLGGWWFAGFVILIMVVALGEFYATLRTVDYRPVALFGLIGVMLMGVGAAQIGPLAIGGWAAVTTVITVLFFSLAPRRQALENAAVTVMGMGWVGLLSFAILIEQGPQPVAYIMFVVLLVAFNDMGAYFVGRSFGRRKLAPSVSPNKTVEGLFGGLIASMVVASILTTFPAWEGIGIARGLIVAVVVGFFAPIGDLIESSIKRSMGVKDMGSVLPGHGGMLDRIDSFLIAVPAVYFVLRGFGLL
ncbi:MAG: phosphatidate cytidylyltransferase [Actinobacteria bacterium]|nr:MAG: phosphatidate cytidylyltransferase [Actinomycetota bacterium]REK40390.1 MAG: phosphatidate cytidylyltransferase [Actinomycetota bacterium]